MIRTNVGGYLPVSLVNSVTLLPAPSDLVFAPGDVKVKLNGGAWVDATGTLRPDEDGVDDGQFTYTVPAGEVPNDGIFKLKVNKSPYALYVVADNVEPTVGESFGSRVLHPDVPAGKGRTVDEALNLIADRTLGDGTGLDGLTFGIKRRGVPDGDDVIAGTTSGGRRTFSRLDGSNGSDEDA